MNPPATQVLLVEDDPRMPEVLAALLHDDHIILSSAKDTTEALTLMRERPFDLVLLDLGLPGMNGFELMGLLKAKRCAARIVILTMLKEEQALNTALNLKVDGYVLKENAAGEIAATIRKVIRELDPAVPIRDSGPWTGQLALSLLPSQLATIALGLFGGFGLLLSITGTFSVASYTVGKRLRELSIRVALGAQGKHVLWAALGRMLIHPLGELRRAH